jgi:hypothetical protein
MSYIYVCINNTVENYFLGENIDFIQSGQTCLQSPMFPRATLSHAEI